MNKGLLLLAALTLLFLSGCSTVVQEVFKAPDANCDRTNITAKNGCKKTDGIPYYLPRTSVKLQFPVTKSIESESKLISEARSIYSNSTIDGKSKCVWDKKEVKLPKLQLCKEEEFDRVVETILTVKYKETSTSKDCTTLKVEADKVGVILKPNYSLVEPIETYKLGEIGISTEAEPDPDQLYFIKLEGKTFEKRSIEVTYSPGGIISQYSASSEDKTGEFVLQTAKAVIQVAAMAIVDEGGCLEMVPSDYQGLIFRASSALKFLKDYPDIRIRELNGTVNIATSKDALELRLKELDASRDSALAVLKPNKKTETKAFTLSLLPTCSGVDCPSGILKNNLAKFSKTCGLFGEIPEGEFVFQSDIPQEPKKSNSCEEASQISIAFAKPPHLRSDNARPSRFENLTDSSKKRGMSYRIPQTVRATISNDKEVMLVKDMPIAQMGTVASLPAETGSSNVAYKVTLDPVTGMLLKVSLTSESASATVGKDVIDPIANYLEAKKESKDEVTKLEREEAILKLKKSIKELKESVGE